MVKHTTCKELSVEHIHSLIVPGVFTLQVDGVQDVFDERRQHHGQQDGILRNTERGQTLFTRGNSNLMYVIYAGK